ncbi:MAG: hypothetical protein U0414_31300 [Polyangiaceae bacterium]
MGIHLHVDPPTARKLRSAAAVALPLVALAITGVALGSPPFVAGETLKAADLNTAFDALSAALETRPEFTEWATFTPTLMVNGANVAVVAADGNTSPGYWRCSGDSVEVRISVTVATCPVASGTLEWGLPNQLKVDLQKAPKYAAIGHGMVVHVANNTIAEHSVMALPNQTTVAMPSNTNGVNVRCSDIGPNGSVRLQFSVPIEGWTLAG